MTVDVRYDTVLRCDEPGCRARYRRGQHWTYARKRAAVDEGWVWDAFWGDFCPAHVETIGIVRKEPTDGG